MCCIYSIVTYSYVNYKLASAERQTHSFFSNPPRNKVDMTLEHVFMLLPGGHTVNKKNCTCLNPIETFCLSFCKLTSYFSI